MRVIVTVLAVVFLSLTIFVTGCASKEIKTVDLDQNLLLSGTYSTLAITHRPEKNVSIYDPLSSIAGNLLDVALLVIPIAPGAGALASTAAEMAVESTVSYVASTASDYRELKALAGVAPGVYMAQYIKSKMKEQYELKVIPANKEPTDYSNPGIIKLATAVKDLDEQRRDKVNALDLQTEQSNLLIMLDSQADLVLDINIEKWETTTDKGKASSDGPLHFYVSMTLIDNKNVAVLAQDKCMYSTDKQESVTKFPFREDYIANDMQLVTEITERATDFCTAQFIKTLHI